MRCHVRTLTYVVLLHHTTPPHRRRYLFVCHVTGSTHDYGYVYHTRWIRVTTILCASRCVVAFTSTRPVDYVYGYTTHRWHCSIVPRCPLILRYRMTYVRCYTAWGPPTRLIHSAIHLLLMLHSTFAVTLLFVAFDLIPFPRTAYVAWDPLPFLPTMPLTHADALRSAGYVHLATRCCGSTARHTTTTVITHHYTAHLYAWITRIIPLHIHATPPLLLPAVCRFVPRFPPIRYRLLLYTYLVDSTDTTGSPHHVPLHHGYPYTPHHRLPLHGLPAAHARCLITWDTPHHTLLRTWVLYRDGYLPATLRLVPRYATHTPVATTSLLTIIPSYTTFPTIYICYRGPTLFVVYLTVPLHIPHTLPEDVVLIAVVDR